MWVLSQTFLNSQLNKKKFEEDLIKFMEENKFTNEQAEHFCLMLQETIQFYTLLPKISYQGVIYAK
jgi:hypothetical protein